MPRVIALVEDLMFLSRVREAARGLGLEVQSLRQPPEAGDPDARLVVVDLDRFGDPAVLLRLRGLPGLAQVPLVGFLSHVNADRARQAREAGCTRVLARSAFVAELPTLMSDASHRTGDPR